jgi:Double-stranded RNA binding motif
MNKKIENFFLNFFKSTNYSKLNKNMEVKNNKNTLQEHYQKKKPYLGLPKYSNSSINDIWFSVLTLPDGEKHEGASNNKKDADQEAAGLALRSILSNDRQKIVEFVKEIIFDILVDLNKTVAFTVYEKNSYKTTYKNLDEYIQGITTKIQNDMEDIKGENINSKSFEDFDTNLYIRILFPCLDLIQAQALERFENKFRRFVGLEEI